MLMIALSLLACTHEDKYTPIEFCDGSTEVLYDPLHPTELYAYPDDWYTTPDTNSPTGIRVDLSPIKAPWTSELGDIFTPVLEDIATRSGFARLGAAVIRFSKPVDATLMTPEESLTNDKLIWLDNSVEPPERIAFTTSLGEELNQLILKPVKPLRAGAKQVIVVTNSFKDSMGNCIAPAPLIQNLINGESAETYSEQSVRVQQALEATEQEPSNISHILTFTTQDDLGLFNDVAKSISENEYTWETSNTCSGENRLYCQRRFISNDYRINGAIEGTEPTDKWSMLVHSWIPTNLEPPYPVIIYGHGLNSSAETASAVADIVNPLGFAVFAIDALHHGQHPTANPDSALPALIFLGINLSEFVFDSRSLRGSFDQSAADRLQLIELLKQQPDLDGDGITDIDTEQMVYYGISLGGLMGSQLMANSQFKAGVLAEGGGDLPVFTTDTTTVDSLADVLEYLVGPPDVFDRMLPVMQTGVDASDPAIWATHVLQNRLDDAQVPDVLFPVCVEDDTVPPATAKALAHGLNIPHLEPVLDSVPMLEVQEGPLHANMASGATAAYFQFDRVTRNGEIVPSNHDNLPNSPEAKEMIVHFLTTHLLGETEIQDPYAVLGTEPLE